MAVMWRIHAEDVHHIGDSWAPVRMCGRVAVNSSQVNSIGFRLGLGQGLD